MINALRPILGSVLVFGLLGCGADAQDDPVATGPEFEVLNSGDYLDSGMYTSKKAVVFDDETSYRESLARYTTAAPAPVDFSTSKVLLVDMGRRQSGGYAISVTSVDMENDAAVAQVTLSVPGPNCVTTDALSNPYQFVRVETREEILVREELDTRVCD